MDHEKEWREHILKKLEKLEDKQEQLLIIATTLKVKIGLIASVWGFLSGVVSNYISSKMH